MTDAVLVARLRELRGLTRLEASIMRQVMDPESDPAWRYLLPVLAAEIARLDADLRLALDAASLPPVTAEDVRSDAGTVDVPGRVH